MKFLRHLNLSIYISAVFQRYFYALQYFIGIILTKRSTWNVI